MDAGGSNSSGNQEMEIVEGNAGTQEIIPGFQTFEAFRQAAFKSLMEATRNSNNLPINENWDYYSSFAPFKRIMNAEGVKVLELIRMVLQHQGMKGNILRRDFEEKFDLIVEANDSILERVSCNLDELSGIRKDPQPNLLQTTFTAPISGSWNVNKAVSTNSFRRNSVTAPIRKFGPENMQRPQIKFKDKVDNSSAPFEPRIKDKPNSLKPLSILLEFNEDGDESFGHPYECELDHFKPPPAQLKRVEPCLFKPIDETPLIHVERKDQLTSLVEDLAKYSEIAVDLEHHSYRTFQGITCLMQISTRDTDYIIDTLELRSDLHCLNEVFTKPSIVKVFHGADHDVEWLQRDLCLYVVNMFDTHQAAKLLNFPQLSLAFLLKHYCGVLADKHFQLADWRIRPLPEELIAYARDDTHYLLYIYDMMKNALLDAANGQDNILSSLYQISTELCKKRYEKPKLREDSHMILYKRNRKLFDNRQLHALKELYKWRDKLARDEDESIGYVLPNHMMLQIAETLPREMQGILACCNPIPTMVRQNLLALHYIILEAREQPLVKPIMQETPPQVRANTQTWSKINLDGPLHCPHDLTHQHDFRDDLPTLLAGTLKDNKSSKKPAEKLKMNPTISVFEVATSDEENDHSKHVAFICPYERYKRVKPFIQSQEIVKNEEETVQNGEDQDSENSERIKRIKNHFLEVSARLEKEKETESRGGKVDQKNYSNDNDIPPTKSETTVSMTPAETIDDLRPLRSKKRKRRSKANKKKANNSVDENVSQSAKRKNVEDTEMDENETHFTKKPRLDVEDNFDEQGSSVSKRRKKQKTPGEGFVAFDYSQINYSRFQGGSKINQTNSNMQGKFKPKGKRGKRGKNNKSMTFGKGKW